MTEVKMEVKMEVNSLLRFAQAQAERSWMLKRTTVLMILALSVLSAFAQEEPKNQFDLDLNMLGRGEMRASPSAFPT